jgi:hypothetical protein
MRPLHFERRTGVFKHACNPHTTSAAQVCFRTHQPSHFERIAGVLELCWIGKCRSGTMHGLAGLYLATCGACIKFTCSSCIGTVYLCVCVCAWTQP